MAAGDGEVLEQVAIPGRPDEDQPVPEHAECHQDERRVSPGSRRSDWTRRLGAIRRKTPAWDSLLAE